MQSYTSWLEGLEWWSREPGFVPSSAFWMTTGISSPLSVPQFPHPQNRSFSCGESLGMLLENSHRNRWAQKRDDGRFLTLSSEGCTGWKGFLSEDVDMIQLPNRRVLCHMWGPPTFQLPLQKGIIFLKVLCLLYLCCLDVSGKPEHLTWLLAAPSAWWSPLCWL